MQKLLKIMLINSKIISLISSKLKSYLKDKDILDIILFGSAIKGKAMPNDIDIAVITRKDIKISEEVFHASILSPDDFFLNPPTLTNTLLREGYSLKHKRAFVENFKFISKVLFRYDLTGLSASNKVRIVNILRGKAGDR